jgi:hypothetical protein
MPALPVVFPRDHILTSTTIYWVNAAIGQSIRSYRNAVRYPWTPSHDRTPAIEAPAGFTFLAGDHYPPGSDVATGSRSSKTARRATGTTRSTPRPTKRAATSCPGRIPRPSSKTSARPSASSAEIQRLPSDQVRTVATP